MAASSRHAHRKRNAGDEAGAAKNERKGTEPVKKR